MDISDREELLNTLPSMSPKEVMSAVFQMTMLSKAPVKLAQMQTIFNFAAQTSSVEDKHDILAMFVAAFQNKPVDEVKSHFKKAGTVSDIGEYQAARIIAEKMCDLFVKAFGEASKPAQVGELIRPLTVPTKRLP